MLYQAKWTVSTYKIMTATTTSPPERSTYRHGDLRRALLEAGIQLARAGGPDAVVLREATRRAGVVPNAAYRHFASRWELLQAVRSAALSALAVAMEAELARLPRGTSPADAARANLRAIGTAYLRFAQEETGLFHTAFAIPDETRGEPIPAKAGNSGLNPFQLLGAALDRLVEAGVLPPERRPGVNAGEGSFLHADRQATEKKRPQVEKNLLPPAVRLKNGEEKAFSAPNKELSAKPKQQSQINCPARPKSPLTGESPIQVASEPDFPGSNFRKGQVAMARLVTSSCTGASVNCAVAV